MKKRIFEPKIITVLREGYTGALFSKDLLAGIIVGVVALPLAIAFSIASGVKPEQGLITAFVAGLLISLLSGSRVQIGGPTGAFIIIILNIVQRHGYDGLAVATLLAGIILVLMGLARIGDVIKYIPYPVTIGFTSGIALVIFATQIRDFLGLSMASVPSHFIDKIGAYAQHLPSLNPIAAGLGIVTILIVRLLPHITKRVPGTIIAILITTALVQWLHLPVETIADRFGQVPHNIPMPKLPHIDLSILPQLIAPAFTIAFLAGIESLLSAIVADGMLGTRHRSNMELVGQGIANIVSPIFSGIPATGAIARTATNIKNGGRTPISGIVHSIVVLLLFLFCARWVSLIPMATLAGILIIVAYQMSEWRHFKRLLKSPRSDIMVLLLTFGLTILVDLTVAIEVGMVMAAFLFMRRMAQITHINLVDEDDVNDRPYEYEGIPEGIEIFEITGPFFFGAADKFHDAIASFKKLPDVLILRMSSVPAVDATALNALEKLLDASARDGTRVIFAGVNSRVYKVFDAAGIVRRIGHENIFSAVTLAIAHATNLLKK